MLLESRLVEGAKYKLYHYDPSFIAASIMMVVFGLSSALHLAQLGVKKTWYFIPFVIGGQFEVIGYAARAINAKQTPNWETNPYAIQSLMLLLAPTLFAASIYMILKRIIILTDGERNSIIKTKWITAVFVSGDVISFLLQSGGGGMLVQAKSKDAVTMGQNMITYGLYVQVAFFALFMTVTMVFHIRMLKDPSYRASILTVPWQQYIVVLYIASFLILVRSVFRIAEYVMGSGGPLMSTEMYLYLFDAALMAATMLLFNIRHPSSIIMGRRDMEREGSIPLKDIEDGGSEFRH
ncbi:hypothetical protein HYFRA_00007394 [Hymenoscyphus fraxineus]|uniref:Uncharacterized protein n=1 Tax=Hymenoscyphus fraxineus TaxID=746836 RepID=A0A9N9KRP8_9HELO|nr:hypothetical protein HYFRA_00007394 [Hymenoscyphus fraxineus]